MSLEGEGGREGGWVREGGREGGGGGGEEGGGDGREGRDDCYTYSNIIQMAPQYLNHVTYYVIT